MDLIFAIGFKPDRVIGITPVPYLLIRNEGKEYYDIYKQLNSNDIKAEYISEDWMSKLIELSNGLKYDELNKSLNKKFLRTGFVEFFDNADLQTKKHIHKVIDLKKVEILNLCKQYSVLLFMRGEKHTENIYPEHIIEYSGVLLNVTFGFEKRDGLLYYRLKVFGNQGIDITAPETYVLTNRQPAIVYKNAVYWFENQNLNGNKLKPFLKKKEIVVDEKLQKDFFRKFIKPVVAKFEYDIAGFDLIQVKPEIKPQLVIEQTFFGNIILTPVFIYGDYKVEFYKEQNLFVSVKEDKDEYYLESVVRDREFENGLLNKLVRAGLKKEEKYFYIDKQLNDKYLFFEKLLSVISEVERSGFKVINYLFGGEVTYETPRIEYTTGKKQDWFDLNIVISIGNHRIKFRELKNHILNRIREYVFSDGTVFIIPDTWFAELYPFAVRTGDESTRIHLTQLKLLKENKLITPDETIAESLTELDIPGFQELPVTLKAKLRDYQKTGFNKLYNLTQKGFGVCLADDMGLGKTLQVITVLQKYFENKSIKSRNIEKGEKQLSLFDVYDNDEGSREEVKPALIIVPKSLVYNWIEELKRFAPELKRFVFQNKDRLTNLRNRMNRVHVVLATYGVVRQDFEDLKSFDFGYLVIDESQAIKNPKSKTYMAVTALQPDYKISMTGTPIENSLYDLWSQMSFLNPNLLGNLRYFESVYVRQIVKDQSEIREAELKKLVSPFIIRRLKKDVARELPEKTEQVIYCTMEDAQSGFYETEKSAVRNRILSGEIKRTNFVEVLAVLNRLRQIAIHPALLEEYGDDVDSGKFDAIIGVMENLLNEGHKFLVFSSFVKHLKLFEKYFIENEIPFSMLTGSDNKRKEIVERFQSDEKIKPFLISVKAGGVGLNITAATYVLIIDPWWNPFVEQQAVDRTHRIGQTKNVTVYKFITKDTIEEKMLNLQKTKLKLSESFIDSGTTSEMIASEIEELLN
jgi:SNF2 family DNA or RNA helicase